jgi:uncharacterized membrane protein YfcA
LEQLLDTQSIAIIALAFGAGGIAKGATGMGLPLIALPALTAVFGLQHAICVTLVPILVTNAWQVWRFRKERSGERLGFIPPLLVGGAIGVAAGTWALATAPERALTLSLGVILLAYVALRLARPTLSIGPALARRIGAMVGVAAGALQGATGISAPIGVTFIHAMALERNAYIYAVSTMFLLFGVTQVAAVTGTGLLRAEWLLESALALAPTLACLPIGQWLAARLSPQAFDRLILAFLTIIGAKMVAGI